MPPRGSQKKYRLTNHIRIKYSFKLFVGVKITIIVICLMHKVYNIHLSIGFCHERISKEHRMQHNGRSPVLPMFYSRSGRPIEGELAPDLVRSHEFRRGASKEVVKYGVSIQEAG